MQYNRYGSDADPNLEPTSVDPVKVPKGPVTRVRAKRFKESLQVLMRAIQDQEQDYSPIEGFNHEAVQGSVMLIQVQVHDV